MKFQSLTSRSLIFKILGENVPIDNVYFRDPKFLKLNAAGCIAIGLIVIQIFFTVINSEIADQNIGMVRSFLNDRRSLTNPYLVAMRIEDLETQKRLACTRFSPVGDSNIFLDLSYKTGCVSRTGSTFIRQLLFLDSVDLQTTIQGNDNTQWSLTAKSLTSDYLKVGLWISRFFVCLLVMMAYYYICRSFQFWKNLSESERRHADAILNLTSQISHDIRSPLSALNMVIGSVEGIPEDKRLVIRNAVRRINDIANLAIDKNKKSRPVFQRVEHSATNSAAEPVILSALLETILSEKRAEFHNRMDVEILADLTNTSDLVARVNPIEFSRVISNLVNNSIEALTGPGRITVSIQGVRNEIVVSVKDNGNGIPTPILAKLGIRGVSFGKERSSESGSGLGISHARQTIETFGGRLSIRSEFGKGTEMIISIPRQ